MKKKFSYLAVILSIFLLVGCGSGKSEEPTKPTTGNNTTVTDQNNEEISKLTDSKQTKGDGHISEIVHELCSDKYAGRVVGTKENENAAEYISNFYKKIGLSYYKGNSYYQSYIQDTWDINSEITKNKKVNNVVGVIKGKDSSKAIILSAHFDHIFTLDEKSDTNEQVPVQGAVDNSSGIAALLETAEKLQKQSEKKKFATDIVIVAFNGEETGLIGALNFAPAIKERYKELYNLNIDCVGAKRGSVLAMGNKDKASKKLYDALKLSMDKNKVKYNDVAYGTENGMQIGTSDHAVFQMMKIPAVGIGQNNIMKIIHKVTDVPKEVDYDSIEVLTDMLVDFIKTNDGKTFN